MEVYTPAGDAQRDNAAPSQRHRRALSPPLQRQDPTLTCLLQLVKLSLDNILCMHATATRQGPANTVSYTRLCIEALSLSRSLALLSKMFYTRQHQDLCCAQHEATIQSLSHAGSWSTTPLASCVNSTPITYKMPSLSSFQRNLGYIKVVSDGFLL